ncbi:MAG TPA: hypothetical protein VK721_13895 [Solirubrobacteraceae bacterium]|nr:hypothetical protein [Solirubrobacteraceae bacterium]
MLICGAVIFGGFEPVGSLERPEPGILPVDSGVYVLVRTEDGPPRLLDRSVGGWWKNQDPTVSHERLEREWVDSAQTLYIGKAKSLRQRVGELIEFAAGEPARHWGGRLVWQVEECKDLLLGWRADPDYGALETHLIDEFREHFGRLPFANLRRGNRLP